MTAAPAAGGRTVIIGIGNEFRRDDGAGPAVVARLSELLPPGVELTVSDGEPVRLIEAWQGASLAVVVDAVRAEPPEPGRLHRFELYRPGSAAASGVSSHGMGLDEAIRLALVLERMPARLIVHAVEVADVSQGTGLTPAVAAATDALVAAVLGDLAAGDAAVPAS
jgi:hydrogenase maturation protease